MIEFPCGCTFKLNEQDLPIIDPNVERLPLDCSRTWDLFCEGNTKGVFQLESQLGQSTSKKAGPRNIPELAAVVSIIRPGCLEAIVDGKSITQHYLDVKNKVEEIKYFHPLLEQVLSATYGQMIYQEQAMQIAQLIANFNLQQADILRKSMGKKSVSLMTKVKKEFVEGAVKHGVVSKKDAEEIFSWIEKSQRYLFNASHAVSYALNAYQTAYLKAHFPKAFFTSYLRHANGKPKPFVEVKSLVQNAKNMGITIQPPSVIRIHRTCELIDGSPSFGITNIKGVGDSVYTQLIQYIKNKKINLNTITWGEFLMRLGPQIRKDAMTNMILAGALDCYGQTRSQMLYDYDLFLSLRPYNKTFLQKDDSKTFIQGMTNMIRYTSSQKQVRHIANNLILLKDILEALNNPPSTLQDLPSWKANKEEEMLGAEITCYKIFAYNTSGGNCSCKEFKDGFTAKHIKIAVKIDDIREWTIKKGKSKGNTMAFLKVSDETGELDSVVAFSDNWLKLADKIFVGDMCLLKGSRDKKGESLVIRTALKLERMI